MLEELLPWYERELGFLKREAARFAKRYPELAARLDLHEHDAENLDPHAERLIQAVALLAARVRLKVEDKFPELSDTFLELLLPHYLASVPSLSVVQFQVDPEQGRITTRHEVPRKTPLLSRPVDGEPCRFRTCYDLDVWPLELNSLRLESPAQSLPRRGASAGVVSALRFRLTSPAGEPIAGMGLDRLRLHMDGLPEVAHGLYEMLLRSVVHIELVGAGRDDVVVAVPLRASALRPVGFAEDEGLLEYPRNAFGGFHLLQEFFALPEKYLFVDLTGLEVVEEVGFGDWMEVHIFSSVPPPFKRDLEATNLRLNCTPIVNLFERFADPINLDDLRRGECAIVPDSHRKKTTETWQVLRVEPVGSDETVGVAPLFAFGSGGALEDSHLTWEPKRFLAEDGAGEIRLALGLPRQKIRQPLPEALRPRVLCTNRNHPRGMQIGIDPKGDFYLDPMPGFLKIVSLTQPTHPLRKPVGREAHWRLISHLALNHVSLLADGGLSLRGLLELYEPTKTNAARQKIAAIQELTGRQTDRFIEGSLLRGTEIDLLLDGGAFAGTRHFLFASVLDRFLGMYAALNSFTQLELINAQDREDRISFAPRAGQQELV